MTVSEEGREGQVLADAYADAAALLADARREADLLLAEARRVAAAERGAAAIERAHATSLVEVARDRSRRLVEMSRRAVESPANGGGDVSTDAVEVEPPTPLPPVDDAITRALRRALG